MTLDFAVAESGKEGGIRSQPNAPPTKNTVHLPTVGMVPPLKWPISDYQLSEFESLSPPTPHVKILACDVHELEGDDMKMVPNEYGWCLDIKKNQSAQSPLLL